MTLWTAALGTCAERENKHVFVMVLFEGCCWLLLALHLHNHDENFFVGQGLLKLMERNFDLFAM